jgi:pimeloyl-ACP methyl ester carboxylesterase
VTDTAGRLARGERLLGLLVQLPGEEELDRARRAGLDLVVVDLVEGSVDDGAMRRLVRSAGWVGLGVIVLTQDPAHTARLRSMGIDGVVIGRDGPLLLGNDLSYPFAVVRAPDHVRAPGGDHPGVVALDLDVALDEMLAGFASTRRSARGEQPLLLLPGMLGDARLFDEVVARLPAGVPTRVARIDLDDSVAEMAESVLAVAAPRVALAGHSLGGIVAMEICRRAPERVSRLALLNSSARPPSDAQLATWAELAQRTEAGDFRALIAEQVLVNVAPRNDDGLIGRWTAMASRVGPDGFLRQLRAQASRPDSRPLLPHIAVPTLVISGSDDHVCPVELQLEIARGVPDSCHVVIDGAGHMTPLDHPGEVAEHLLTWLNDDILSVSST